MIDGSQDELLTWHNLVYSIKENKEQKFINDIDE